MTDTQYIQEFKKKAAKIFGELDYTKKYNNLNELIIFVTGSKHTFSNSELENYINEYVWEAIQQLELVDKVDDSEKKGGITDEEDLKKIIINLNKFK